MTASKHQEGISYRPKDHNYPNWPYPRYFISAELMEEFREAEEYDLPDGNKHTKAVIKSSPPHTQELVDNVEVVDYVGQPTVKHEDAYELSVVFVLPKRNHITARYDARQRLGPEFWEETAADTQVVFLKHPVSRVQPVIAKAVVVNLDCGSTELSPLMGGMGAGHAQGYPAGVPLLCFESPEPIPLVVLFEHDRAHSELGISASKQCALWLNNYLYQWFHPTLDHPITLVGLSEFFSVQEDYEVFEQEFHNSVPSGNNVEFLTREQYQQRVGSDTYRLHAEF